MSFVLLIDNTIASKSDWKEVSVHDTRENAYKAAIEHFEVHGKGINKERMLINARAYLEGFKKGTNSGMQVSCALTTDYNGIAKLKYAVNEKQNCTHCKK